MVAGGLVLIVTASGCRRMGDAVRGERPGAGSIGVTGGGAEFAPVVYLRIAPNGDVTIIGHRSEMGQGSRTSLAMIIADELEADWARVRIEQAPGDEKTYGNQNTDGSSSIRDFFLIMRRAGATARTMLEAAAAKHWGVSVGDVTARLHRVVHQATGRTIDYGDLTAVARTLPVPTADQLRLKQPAEYRYIGKEIPMVDQMDITTGRAQYGIDQRLPGMFVAVIARPPVYGGTIARLDSQAAEQTPGVVRVIQMDHTPPPSGMAPLGGVAVLARDTWAAIQGRNALKIEWADGPHGSYDSRAYRRELLATARRPGQIARDQGNVHTALATAARRFEADYYVPHLSHAPMEPVVALASVRRAVRDMGADADTPGRTRCRSQSPGNVG